MNVGDAGTNDNSIEAGSDGLYEQSQTNVENVAQLLILNRYKVKSYSNRNSEGR